MKTWKRRLSLSWCALKQSRTKPLMFAYPLRWVTKLRNGSRCLIPKCCPKLFRLLLNQTGDHARIPVAAYHISKVQHQALPFLLVSFTGPKCARKFLVADALPTAP